tara:strand:+ start:849 stop:1088 length:240 start_codon:yes stop_codon:yes gene_type:complete
MFGLLKKILFSITLNSALFLLLMIGIQNSSNRSKVKFIIGETVFLPISFIVGISFITGSIYGNLLTTNFSNKSSKLDSD